MVKSKVSYVVLKSDVVGKGKPAVVLKHGGHVEPLSELGGQKPASGAENTTGPWLCHSCGSNEEPVHFETYYLYRRHLQDVHMEKIDARICEHCGHRASKRNLLLYHLYTKHGVPPPRNCQFPKCDQCDYVALSESLLIKHRNNHSNNKEFVCKVCNATFKSNGALQGHMQTNLHSDPAKKLYECPFCQKPFVRNINLKAHIRTSHKEVIRKMDEEEKLHMEGKHKQFANLQHFEDEGGEEAHPSDAAGEDSLNADEEEEGEIMEVPVIDAVMQKAGSGAVMLPSGVTVLAEAPAVQSLVPSSEAEALSNVASGIAASLGLADTLTGEQTVIVLDENQEFILHSTEVVEEEITSTDGKDVVDVSDVGIGELQEYIVPEIMPDEGQEQHDQSYTGPLSDLAHYSGAANPTMTVPPQQTATAPPPVSVAVSVVGGDEVTMVLTDHDYAPMRETSVEGMMFFITQPTEETEEHDVKCSGRGPESEPQLPVLEKEPPPPTELTAEPPPCAIPADIKYSNIAPILTRESIIPHGVSETVVSTDEQMISNSVVSERNTDDVTVIEEIPPITEGSIQGLSVGANNQESQVEQMEGLVRDNNREQEMGTNERGQEAKVIMASSVEGLRLKESSAAKESKTQEQKEQEVVTEGTGRDQHDDIDNEEDESSQASPVKKPVVSNAPIRRQPPVQMADIMKEWDDFDDDENDSSEPFHRSESEIRPHASEGEPKVLRGPQSEDH